MAKANDGTGTANSTQSKKSRPKPADARQVLYQTLLKDATLAKRQLGEALPGIRAKVAGRAALEDHLTGLYGEIDKLAKGKSLMEATPLIVASINDVVRDAKAIVEGDPHLDRVKEFVPAGSNPVYPDVLVVARAVLGALERSEDPLTERQTQTSGSYRVVETIACAIDLQMKLGRQATADDVYAELHSRPVAEWFYKATDGQHYFNVERLLRVGVRGALAGDE